MMTMNLEDPHQVEDAMEKQLEKHHHEAHGPAHALKPGRRPARPGHRRRRAGRHQDHGLDHRTAGRAGRHDRRRLVGTFLGVFIAYGLVGPFATRLNAIVDEDAAFYKIIQAVLVAHLHGNAAQISVEIGRGNVPSPGRRPARSP
jgi:chemotaxis protein MotA